MDRREALRRLGLGLGGIALGGLAPAGCGGASGAAGSPGAAADPTSDARLAPPRPAWTDTRFTRVEVADERVIRTVVGHRPYRPSGFVVEAQRFDGTLVVHDYGHGGGGVTLSWGAAEMAVAHALTTDVRDVAVLGCGAVGLATARLLQRAGRRVTLYTRDLPPHTTSNVAGAQFSPYSVYDEEEATPAFRRRLAEATRRSHRLFQDFLGPRYGVRFVENVYVEREPVELPGWMTELADVFPDVRTLEPGEHPFPFPHAVSVTTLFIEPGPYLRELLSDVREAGGTVVVRDFRDLSDVLALPERVIMNCTGMGARELFGDDAMIPVKGQLTVLRPQPGVDYLLLRRGLYMFPRSDGVLLGGTFQRGDWSLDPDPAAERRVLDGHRRIFAGERT